VSVARYDIVPERSEVWINATSSLHPIHSRTAGLDGFLDLELNGRGRVNLSVAPKGQLSLPVERLSSGNPLEDRELRRRIDSRRFPTIDGRLTEMSETGADGRYVVRGDVTFRGVTNPYEDEMSVAQLDDNTLRLEGESTFDIRDFGMEPPRILMLRVHPQVAVKVAIVARKEG
jgi:polyisoprenoid-binding protein YceI